MKFQIEKEKIQKALRIISNCIESGKELSDLSNYVLFKKNEEGKLELQGYNQFANVKVQIDFEPTEDINRCFPLAQLTKFIDLLEGEISFDVKENNWVDISSGGSKRRMALRESDNFPNFELPDEEIFFESISIDPKIFQQMVKNVSFAVAKLDQPRWTLRCMVLKVEDKTLILRATDGKQFTEARIGSIDKEKNFEVLLPAQVIAILIKMCESSEENISITPFANKCNFSTKNINLSARLLTGKFPDVRKLLGMERKYEVKVSGDELQVALKRSLLVSEDNKNLTLNILPKNLIIESSDKNLGISRETLDCESTHPTGIKITLVASQVLAALHQNKGETQVIYFNDFNNPVVIKPELADQEFIYLTIPVVNNEEQIGEN